MSKYSLDLDVDLKDINFLKYQENKRKEEEQKKIEDEKIKQEVALMKKEKEELLKKEEEWFINQIKNSYQQWLEDMREIEQYEEDFITEEDYLDE